MQADRRIARLTTAALALAITGAAIAVPADAQRRPRGGGGQGAPQGPARPAAPALPPPAPVAADPLAPIALFNQVCLGSGVKLTRSDAASIAFERLPPDARRALAQGADDLGIDADASDGMMPVQAAPNPVYAIENGASYLIAPTREPVPGAAMADSCAVAWRSSPGQDYMDARRLVLPADSAFDLPLTARPSAHANGAVSASAVNGTANLTVSAYNGWVALRSSPVAGSSATPATTGAQ